MSAANVQIERWRKLLYAEVQATGRAMLAVRTIPEQHRQGYPALEACRRLAHIQSARHEWLARVGFIPHRPWDMFPSWSIDETEQDAARLDESWGEFLNTLSDADLSRPVRYTSTEGTPWISLLDDILTHVFNHSTYHRGQVAMLIRQAGGESSPTDYIVLTRSPCVDAHARKH